MRLESVLAATGGRLLGEPCVTRFDEPTLSLKKVERGTLYLAKDPETIPEALKRGAYGILAEKIPAVLDDETAWIEVDSFAEALPRLLRLWLMEHPRAFYAVDASVLAYMAQMSYDHGIVTLDGSFETMSEAILASHPDQRLFCADTLFLDRMGVSYETPDPRPEEATILASTLFETTAVLEGRYHERLPVPPCTFDAFARALALLKQIGAHHTLFHLRPVPAFDPLFLTRDGHEAPFGATQRVAVLVDSVRDCGCVEAFDRAAWLPNRLFLPTRIKLDCAIKTAIETYETLPDLVGKVTAHLHAQGFALVVGLRRREFLEALQRFGTVSQAPITKGLF